MGNQWSVGKSEKMVKIRNIVPTVQKNSFSTKTFSWLSEVLVHPFDWWTIPGSFKYKESDLCEYDICTKNGNCSKVNKKCYDYRECWYEKCIWSWRQYYIDDIIIFNYKNNEIWIHFKDFIIEWIDNQKRRKDHNMIDYTKIYPEIKKIQIDEGLQKNPDDKLFNWSIYVSKNCQYLSYQPIIEADFDTFKVRTWWRYASDKNHTYIFWGSNPSRKNPNNTWSFDDSVSINKWVVEYPFYRVAKENEIEEILKIQKEIEKTQ